MPIEQRDRQFQAKGYLQSINLNQMSQLSTIIKKYIRKLN